MIININNMNMKIVNQNVYMSPDIEVHVVMLAESVLAGSAQLSEQEEEEDVFNNYSN